MALLATMEVVVLKNPPFSKVGFTLWLTGLPCSGKSTLAKQIMRELQSRGLAVEIMDGDLLRTTLCKGLGFSKEDRIENICRIGWVCGLLERHGVIAIGAVISPYREARERLRASIPGFVEIYVKAPLAICMERDVKGMYAKARAGEISHFTGVDDPYEEPVQPEIVVETHRCSISECVHSILTWLEEARLVIPRTMETTCEAVSPRH